MKQYHNAKVKLSDSQIYKWKSATKNAKKTTLKISENINGDANHKTGFPHKLMLTDRQVLSPRKFSKSSANIRFLKTQMCKTTQ